MNHTKTEVQSSLQRRPKTLIWLQTGFIGDIVLLTGAIELAQKHFPESKQHLITTAAGAAILAGHPHLASITIFDKRSGTTLTAFKQVKESLRASLRAGLSDFDTSTQPVLLQIHRSYRSSLLALFLGFPRVVFQETFLTWGAVAKVSQIAVFPDCQRQAVILEPFGISRKEILSTGPHLTAAVQGLSQEWTNWLSQSQERVVAISPGSVWGTKRWPRQGFAVVLTWLLKETSCRIVLLGSEGESDLCKAIAEKAQKEWAGGDAAQLRLINLAGRTSLSQLRGIYPKLSALVANDSSAVHFASAFQVPTVAIFGATIPQMGFAPSTPGSKSIGIAIECRPCSDHGPQVCPLGHFRCMKEITPAVVIEALNGILSGA